jgi:hypothetical protein
LFMRNFVQQIKQKSKYLLKSLSRGYEPLTGTGYRYRFFRFQYPAISGWIFVCFSYTVSCAMPFIGNDKCTNVFFSCFVYPHRNQIRYGTIPVLLKLKCTNLSSSYGTSLTLPPSPSSRSIPRTRPGFCWPKRRKFLAWAGRQVRPSAASWRPVLQVHR